MKLDTPTCLEYPSVDRTGIEPAGEASKGLPANHRPGPVGREPGNVRHRAPLRLPVLSGLLATPGEGKRSPVHLLIVVHLLTTVDFR